MFKDVEAVDDMIGNLMDLRNSMIEVGSYNPGIEITVFPDGLSKTPGVIQVVASILGSVPDAHKLLDEVIRATKKQQSQSPQETKVS